ncbi:MAG: hypothetical protein ACK4YP_05000 [Myxococcota bacterium]
MPSAHVTSFRSDTRSVRPSSEKRHSSASAGLNFSAQSKLLAKSGTFSASMRFPSVVDW